MYRCMCRFLYLCTRQQGRDIDILFCCAMMLLCCTLVGCGSDHPQASSDRTFQRFLPVSGAPQKADGTMWSGAFALDTITGQLCYTYDDPGSKKSSLPVCRDLLDKK